jgi:hypothetical protein
MLVSCQARKQPWRSSIISSGCAARQGKDGNPLNDVRMIGDKLSLTSDGFAKLATAFFAEIERKYVAAWRQTRRVPAKAASNSR